MASSSSTQSGRFRRGLSVRLNRFRRKFQHHSDDASTPSPQRPGADPNIVHDAGSQPSNQVGEVSMEASAVKLVPMDQETWEDSLFQPAANAAVLAVGGISWKLCKNCHMIDLNMSWDSNQGSSRIIEKKILHDVSYILRGGLSACELCRVLTKITSLDPSKEEKDERRYLCVQSTSQLIYYLLPTDVPLVYVTNKGTIRRPRNFLLPVEPTPGSTSVSGRVIPRAIQWQVVKDWLGFCHNNHNECCTIKEWTPILHLRVIDCWAEQIVAAEDRDLEFVTLSYTWGNEDHDTAFGDSLPDNIPCTISDAMQTVKALGLRFLWVDRYCIPQYDCPEKTSLIRNMGKIYGASILTLIAAAGRDPSYGLPGVGPTLRRAQSCIKFGKQSFATVSLDVIEELKTSKWNSRAWTFQETLLSRRKLVFLENGLLYQCGGMYCIEALMLPLKELHTADKQGFVHSFKERFPSILPTLGVGESMSGMLKMIEEFSARDITHSKDTIDAFEGIFQAFAETEFSITHFHGVLLPAPESFKPPLQKMSDRFFFGLGWKLRGPACRRASFPSWTWAGWALPAHIGTRYLHELGTDTEQRYPAGPPANYPAYFSYHFALLDISVEFEDQVIIPLEQAYHKYLQNRSFGNWPTYLHVTGMVSTMVIERIEEKPGDGDYRIITFAGKDSWRHRLPGCEIQLPPNSPTTIPISALLYGHDDYSLQFILLVKVESEVYERVGMSPRIFYKDMGMKKRWSHNFEPLSMEDYHFRRETIRFG